MSFLDDVIAFDAEHAFADTFGEPVTYTKRSGASRVITAIVTRYPPAPAGADYRQPAMDVSVVNSATTGISAAEVDFGGDTIAVALKPGGAARAYKIHQPADGQPHVDAGMLRLELH